MRKLKQIINQDGITLLEVLLSIVILSLILVTILNVFPQMGFLNQQNETKLQGINTARQVLIQWQEKTEVKNFLLNPAINTKPAYLTDQGAYYVSETTRNNQKVIVKIAKGSDLGENIPKASPTKVYQIHVQLQDIKNKIIGESFGYLVVGE